MSNISRSSNFNLFTHSNRTSRFSIYEPLILEPEILEDIRWVSGSLEGCLFNTSSSRVYCRSNIADSFTNALFSWQEYDPLIEPLHCQCKLSIWDRYSLISAWVPHCLVSECNSRTITSLHKAGQVSLSLKLTYILQHAMLIHLTVTNLQITSNRIIMFFTFFLLWYCTKAQQMITFFPAEKRNGQKVLAYCQLQFVFNLYSKRW